MSSRLFAFAIWTAVVASLMFWALRLGVSSPKAPSYTTAAADQRASAGDLTRVFGAPASNTPAVAAAAPSPAASRFKLVGVAAPRDEGQPGGLALISVDGKPPKAVNVGRTVDEGWILQAVGRRSARIAANLGGQTVDLELPALAAASRGSLPTVGIDGTAGAGVPGTSSIVPAPNLPSAGMATRVPPPGVVNGAPNVPTELMQPPGSPGFSSPPPIMVPPEELQRQQGGMSEKPGAASKSAVPAPQ